jgi:hypothetical protein
MRLRDETVDQSKLGELEKSSIDSQHSGSDVSDSDFISSGNEGDKEVSPVSARRKKSIDSSSLPKPPICCEGKPSKKKRKLIDTIDIMTRRLLLAASRTRGGGDAYFVVKDMFGGEGVQVVPSRVQTYGPYYAGYISPTIELRVRLASITIKCHSVFDVYPDNVDAVEPLIQFKTTTTETIELQEVRVDDHGLELKCPPKCHVERNENTNFSRIMLKEKMGELSGRRFLTITPAKYERVDNWHTPS